MELQSKLILCRTVVLDHELSSGEKSKYLTQLPEENGKAIHDEEVAANTGKPDATKQQERFITSLSSSSTTVMPIDHRNWYDIPAVDYVDEKSFFFFVSKSMTLILRHRGLHREIDGAIEWNNLLCTLCGYHPGAFRWTNKGSRSG